MSGKPLHYDAYASLAELVAAVLMRCGPCDTRTIVRELRREGHRPRAAGVNKALTQYLAGRAVQRGRSEWALLS
jgi:hypothetical protein